MSSNSSLAKATVPLLSKLLTASTETSAEEEVHENEAATHDQKAQVRSDVERALESIDITVPGAYPDTGEDDSDLQYLQYLRAQKEEEYTTRLERQTSKQLQEQLKRRREEAVKAKCRQTQEIKRIDDYLRELVVAEARDTYQMAGPASTKQD